MKKLLLIALVTFLYGNTYAQEINKYEVNEKNVKCMKDLDMPANAKLAWPSCDYVPTQDAQCAPCYTYTSKHGTEIMECPFLNFTDPNAGAAVSHANGVVANNGAVNLDVRGEGTYTGDYPKTCKRDPNMPVGAKPSWPKSPYVSLVAPQCAPCYTYTNKHGLDIMECPGLIFYRLPNKF